MVAGGHGKGTGSVEFVVFVTSKANFKNNLKAALLFGGLTCMQNVHDQMVCVVSQ